MSHVMRRTGWLLVVGLIAGHVSAATGLRWESTALEPIVRAGQDRVVALFAFHNDADRSVTISSVQPSCGCTTTALEKSSYAPGERGVLTVVLEAAGLAGLQEKAITVWTDADPAKPTLLTLRVNIPEVLGITPRLLTWSVGDPPTAKEVSLVLNKESGIKITGVTADQRLVKVDLKETGRPQHLTLIIKPISTAAGFTTHVEVDTQLLEGMPHSYSIQVRVR